MTKADPLATRAAVVFRKLLLLATLFLLSAPAAQLQSAEPSLAGGKNAPVRLLGPVYSAQNPQNPSASAHPAPASGSVLEVYPCQPGEAATLAAQLQQEFGQEPDVRIVPDARTSQVLVRASPQMHARIAERLNAPRNKAPVAASAPAAPPSQPQPKKQEFQLRHVTATQIESSLVTFLGDRLTSVGGPGAGAKSYRLTLPGNQQLSLTLHQQANRLTAEGGEGAVDACRRLIEAIDVPNQKNTDSMRLISMHAPSQDSVRKAVDAIRTSGNSNSARGPLVARLFQQPGQIMPAEPEENQELPGAAPANSEPAPAGKDGALAPPATGQPADGAGGERGLIGPVQIELLEGLDVIVVRGHKRDVDQVMEIINQIEKLSTETAPTIEVYQLRFVSSQAMSDLITPLYSQVFMPRQGNVSITPLVKPNALLLIGRAEAVQTAIDLIKRLDRPVPPETQFQVFRLRHAAAATAEQTLTQFFTQRTGLGTRVLVIADYRSNSLIVQASPRDLTEVGALIERIDVATVEAVNDLRVFRLENTLAEDVAATLREAINAQSGLQTGAQRQGGTAFGMQPGQGGQFPGATQGGTPGATGTQRGTQTGRSTSLRFVTVDPKGQRKLNSGILTDVTITADARANTLLVAAPPESMDLIEALIRQLDQMPAAEAQIKVFTVVNGDASTLMEMLEQLFGQSTTAQRGGAGGFTPFLPMVAIEGGAPLIRLRFAVDPRTNSIIASGSAGDLRVVEAILLRLDASDVRQRRSTVYRLKNAPATNVAQAINDFLRSERQVLTQTTPGLVSPFEQIEREVVVVPETVSNSLIVSSTPRYFEEIQRIVEQLDQRPPMVMIQVLIAEVALTKTDEFGVELGLQDSILFDRSLLGDLVTTTNTVQTSTSQGVVTNTQQVIQAASNTPGFGFNNLPLGNSGSDKSLSTAGIVGTQGLSSFSLGRVNNELGFGGLVLSASSESVSVLLRALKECRRLEVLSRPQVMTLDNQPAFIQVGQRVPRIVATTITEFGQTNQTTLDNVGLIMGVTPRISPDGLVVMEIDAERSDLGPEAEGVPISITNTGQVLRSPRFNVATAQTTVSAADGQTVVLGGLITKQKNDNHRKVPLLGDIPVLGNLFRYDLVSFRRTELLIILTPQVVRGEVDAEKIKRAEAARMSWCLSDVLDLQPDPGLRTRSGEWSDAETRVIYPDWDPAAQSVPGPNGFPPGVPPAGAPAGPEMIPAPNRGPLLPAPMPPAGTEPIPAPNMIPSASANPQPPSSNTSATASEPRPAETAQFHPGRFHPTAGIQPVPQPGFGPPLASTPTGSVVPAAFEAPPQGTLQALQPVNYQAMGFQPTPQPALPPYQFRPALPSAPGGTPTR